jgi:acid phosphatase type 7
MSLNRRSQATLFLLASVVFAAVLGLKSSSPAAQNVDLKPVGHWLFNEAGMRRANVVDRANRFAGRIVGEPKLVTESPARLELNGLEDGVLLRPVAKGVGLPTEAITLASWVRVDVPLEWGGIVGYMQDNGSFERGWVLGFDKSNFFLGLTSSTKQSMTYLRGKMKYEPGRWYHVAAVYDGQTMQLFVNGELDGESHEQRGPISYPDKAPFVLGRYQDDDESFGLTGAIREVLVADRAAKREEVKAHFQQQAELAKAVGLPKMLFVVEPYLQNATRTGMTILCETPEPTSCTIQYGLNTPLKETISTNDVKTMHELRLEKLQPGTKYFYQVTCKTADGRTVASEILTFQTVVAETDAWSFTVIGDTQRNPVVTGKIAKLMWERRPHFVLHNGDVVDDGAAKSQWTGDLFTPSRQLFSRVVMFPCIGNHEKNHAQYYQYFSLPKPEYYYSYKYGNAEFFSIDTNKTLTLVPGGEQYEWLDKALTRSDATWKVVYHHHPVLSSDSDDYGNTWKTNSTNGDARLAALGKLYEKHNVDICFNGHIHLYERSWPVRDGKVNKESGVIHITSGGGGGSLEDFNPVPTWFKAECRVDFHYCYVTVHGRQLNFKAFDIDNRLFDQFSKTK